MIAVCPVLNAGHLVTQQIWSDLLSESLTRSSLFPAEDIVVLHFLAGDEPLHLSSGQHNVKGCDESLPDLAPVIFLEILIGFLFLFFKKNISFYFLLLAELGLRCSMWAFSSCGKWAYPLVAVCGLLLVVASLVAEHGL